MDQKSRVLPHLNAYFLQRKAYDVHRKKIEQIRNSMTRSKLIKPEEESKQKLQDGAQVKPPLKYSIHTIKEQIKNELSSRLSPWAKRQRESAQIQNHRLYDRIQKCSSTISRKDIQNHRIKNEEIKERLSKFIYSPNSHKTLLKCKYSLEILRQKEKRREQTSQAVTRNPSRLRYTKSEISQLERQGSSEMLNFQSRRPIEKKGSLDRLYILRNRSKIRSHFDKGSELRFSVNKNRESSELYQNHRVKTQIRQGKNQCFTTEIE